MDWAGGTRLGREDLVALHARSVNLSRARASIDLIGRPDVCNRRGGRSDAGAGLAGTRPGRRGSRLAQASCGTYVAQ